MPVCGADGSVKDLAIPKGQMGKETVLIHSCCPVRVPEKAMLRAERL